MAMLELVCPVCGAPLLASRRGLRCSDVECHYYERPLRPADFSEEQGKPPEQEATTEGM